MKINRVYGIVILIVVFISCGESKKLHQIQNPENMDNIFSFTPLMQWTPLGPFGSPVPLADSGVISPHGAGRFMCVLPHPKNRNEILIGHASSGLFRTTNGGAGWKAIEPLHYATGIQAMVRFRNDPLHILACAGTDIGTSRQYGYGLLESFDGGESWQSGKLFTYPSEYKTEVFRDVAVFNRRETGILCVSDHKVYLSTDAGQTFETVFSTKVFLKKIVLNPSDENEIFVCGEGLFHTLDGGKTWTDLSMEAGQACGIPVNSYTRFHAGFSTVDENLAYIVMQNERVCLSGLDLKKMTFRLINRSACPANIARLGFLTERTDGHEEVLWLGTVRLFKSTDGGHTFTQSGTPATAAPNHQHDDINQIYHGESGIYVATDGGVDFSSDGGANWSSLTNSGTGLNASLMFGFDVSPRGIAAAGTQDNGIFFMSGGKWTCAAMYGDGGRVKSLDDSCGFACGFAQMTVRTSDCGNTFTYSHAGSEYYGFEFPIRYIRRSGNLYVANNHLYRKKGNGRFEILSGGTNADRKIKAIWINEENEDEMWMARDDPSWGNDPVNKLLHSTDGGRIWTDKSSSLPVLKWRSITDLHISGGGEIAVSLEAFDAEGAELNKVFISADGGNTFTNQSDGLPNLPVNTLVFAENRWICGTNSGIYVLEYGKWTPLGEGFPASIVTEIKYFREHGVLMASTFGRGLWAVRIR